MTDSPIKTRELEPELSDAAWRVDRFVRRFEPSYRELARYAAMPLVLTPELLGYLRVEFLRGRVDWLAEADLLLSDLCRPVGYEQYVLQPEVRSLLLAELEAQHPADLERLATLLIQYVRYLARTNRYFSPREQQPQAWSAMLYIAEERQKVADQIAAEFERVGRGLGELTRSGAAKREMGRLAKIVQDLAPKLDDPHLVAYAQKVTRALRAPQTIDPEDLQASYRVGDRVLPNLAHVVGAGVIATIPRFPTLQRFEFTVLEFGGVPPAQTQKRLPALQRVRHEFTVATIEFPPKARQKQPKLVIQRTPKQDWQYVAALPEGVNLELVKLPAGRFLMGSPEDEPESYSDERPQHEVSVPAFYCGKYPVTQAQWRVIAALSMVDRELNPDPSHFKGDDRPVEQVSWHEAIEFCKRLSVQTGQDYRLPSEAEWEYACRAETKTPFHFGTTIDAEIANYRAQDWEYEGKTYPGTYGQGRYGEFRSETTIVGSFKVANDFGLYDMHGNVWEWCLDHWHEHYDGAPVDGSAWIDESNAEEDAKRLLRGGSWFSNPVYCRSASRSWDDAGTQFATIGFRVVCAFPREDSL